MNLVAHLDAKDRRACHVDIAGVDQRTHVLVEERKQQDTDMGAVDICIGHDDDLVVAGLGDIKISAITRTRSHAAANGRDERLNGVGGESSVIAHALDVQDFAAQGQDGLDVSATAVLSGATCRVALYNEELGHLGITYRAVGKLSGERRGLEQALTARRLACLARRVASLGCLLGLLDDLTTLLGVFLKVIGQTVGNDLEHQRTHERTAELSLGLTLELRVGKLDGDDGRKALAHVITREVGFFLLKDALLARIVVDHTCKRGAESFEMHTSLGGVDIVGKAHDRLGIRRIPLQGNLDISHSIGRNPFFGRPLDIDGVL